MTFLMNIIQNLIQASKEEPSYTPKFEVLEYIQLDGTQYFNLGFKSELGTGYEMGVQFDDLGSSGCGVCGSRDNSSASENNIGTFVGSSTSVVSDYNNSSYTGSRYTIAKTDLSTSNWYDIYNYRTGRGIRLNGAEVGTPNTTTATTTFTTVNDFYLGGYNGFNLTPFKGKIKYFKSVNPAMDIIPVLDSQMRPCFYDRISKQFYYHTNSSGTTTPAYKRWNKFDVDYIESSGTQYIDTGYIPTNNSVYKFKAECTEDASGKRTVFGSQNSNHTASVTAFLFTNGTSPKNARWGTNTVFNEQATALEPHSCILSKDGYDVDGVTESFTSGSFTGTSTNSVVLFALHISDGSISSISNIKLWNFIIEENGSIKRNYKPTVWHNGNTTAVACLYDEVYNKMYTNAGTGSFKAYITTETTGYTLSDGVQNDDYYISSTGVVTASTEFCYTDAIPVKQGDVITLDVTVTDLTPANKRVHGYTTNADIPAGQKGSWVSQLGSLAFSETATSELSQSLTITVPSGVNYIRLSHSNTRETVCDIKITRTYEVGSNCFATPTTSSNYFDSGLYGNEKWNVKLLAYTSTNVTGSNYGQLFGAIRGAQYAENLTINTTGATGSGATSRFDSKSNATTSTSTVFSLGADTKALCVINGMGMWQDNVQKYDWSNPEEFTTQNTCLILKAQGSNSLRPNGCCYCLIEENQIPIAEYIPVKNASVSSEYGLYDRVNGTLNTGIGTITFNALS